MKQRLFFIAILVLGSILRLYNISSVPPSPSLDEVSIGYNAYSILKTGADEYGEKFPILLRAYDDWRPALYVYLVIPFIFLFDLSVLAVRLPSVIISVLTIVATYFLTKELLKNSTTKQFSNETIALMTALLLAISPWHIYISRLGHEVNAGLAFLLFGALFFLQKRFFPSIVFLTFSFISYQSEKIIIPLLTISAMVLYRADLLKYKKQVILGILFSLLLIAPFVKASLHPQALIRFSATNAFVAQQERFSDRAKLLAIAVKENNILEKIIYNRRFLVAQIFIENYISHFNPRWLFGNYGQDKHKVPNLGLLYIWELPFILVGIVALIKMKINIKTKIIIFVWFFIAPIPASITTDAPHAMRSYTFLPIWQIFSSMGIMAFITFVKVKKLTQILYAGFSIIFLLSIWYFSFQYFFVFPKTQSASFQYAQSLAMLNVLENKNHYNTVVFSNENNLYQSYMFFLFFSKYDPIQYLALGGTISGGYAQAHKFDRYVFEPIDKKKQAEKNTLYIINTNENVQSGKILKTFKDLDGEEKIKILSL